MRACVILTHISVAPQSSWLDTFPEIYYNFFQITKGGGLNTMSELRKALVTGAGSGIGRHVAVALMQNGFSVTLVGRREESLKETATLAEKFASNALVTPGDVSKPNSVRDIFSRHIAQFGRLDLLFNNAGINVPDSLLEDMPFSDWDKVVSINLTGYFLCAQQAVRIMKAQKPRGGRIINNGSVSAQVPRPLAVAYNATKHAVLGLTKSISLEGRSFDICCTQLDIGNAATELTESMETGMPQGDGSIRPETRMHVGNVSQTVLYLANLPLEANVPFLTITSNTMPFIGRG